MRPSEAAPAPRRAVDARAWIALAWAVAFGSIYAHSMLSARAPGLVEAIRRSLGG